MPLTTIIINNKNYQLVCELDKENELKMIAAALNDLVMTFKDSNKGASSEILLLMAALKLQSDSMNVVNSNLPKNSEQVKEVLSLMINYLEELEEKFNK